MSYAVAYEAARDLMQECRLASEFLQGIYEIPPSNNANSLLACHERGLFEKLQSFLQNGAADYRSDTYAQNITSTRKTSHHALDY
ncbi:hypothetical protein AC578_8394 [Pseudocercospora eumusae]|uniref:Uncharacterized protein n=1 Tax=Pseudocercospora eumusae TaxID=321146 RepID=A0A139HS26_9PEZI|nr:hypothetical protein AC578_8394 [Pseudocercospora eumusae]